MLARRAAAALTDTVCRPGYVTATSPAWARHPLRKPASPGNYITPSSSAPPSNSVGPVAEEWTPVVHEQSGQTYYWNQQTGMPGAARLL